MHGLYAIIVNYCQPEETLGCVASLVDAGLPRSRIVVVDNASPDGSGAELAEALEGCLFLQATENRGYGAGNNLAIEHLLRTKGDDVEFVFVANPDVRLEKGALTAAVESFEGKDDLGGVSSVQREAAGRSELDPMFERWLRSEGVDPGRIGDGGFVPTTSLLGAAMALSREALLDVGGFDPLYFLYSEEEDLARRLRYHGYEVGVAGGSLVVHSRPYLEEGRDRQFDRHSSGYLYRLKDPSSPVPRNVVRVARKAAGELMRCVRRRDRRFRDWARELAWFLRRVPEALAHRRREMEGRTHLDLSSGGTDYARG